MLLLTETGDHTSTAPQSSKIPGIISCHLLEVQCVTITLCFAVSVQSSRLPAKLELHWLHHPGLQVSVGKPSADPAAHASEHSDKPHHEGEFTPVLLFKANAKRNWFLVKAGFSSGIATTFWIFFISKCSQKGRGKQFCSTTALGQREKNSNDHFNPKPISREILSY